MSTPPTMLVPARILNEHVYCPRLAYLEWVDRQFTDNADTAEGTFVHRRVDTPRGAAPEPGDAADGSRRSTSVTVSSECLGLIARIDVLEAEDGRVVPVEFKRGSPREGDGPPLWEPELVQLCAQALILRDAGHEVERAEVYFAETRTRHAVELTPKLEERTLAAAAELRANAARGVPPPPLVDSPKCPRCSLVGICLPDEVNALADRSESAPRRLVAGDSSAQPLYAAKPGSRITKRGARVIAIEDGKEVASRRLLDVSHIAAFGNVNIGSALLRECFDAGIPVLWLTAGGWLSGFASGMPAKNVNVRIRQHRAASIGAGDIAAAFVAGKLRNQRTLLRRHGGADARTAVGQLARLAQAADEERDTASLLGIEGTGAALLRALRRAAARRRPGWGVRLRGAQPPSAARSGQRAAVVRLRTPDEGCGDGGARRRPGSVCRPVPPTRLRAPLARARPDGGDAPARHRADAASAASSSSAADEICRPTTRRSGDASAEVASQTPGSARSADLPVNRAFIPDCRILDIRITGPTGAPLATPWKSPANPARILRAVIGVERRWLR
jgi:CRISPR-associated protein Cas4